jgi:cytochrome P450
MVSPTSNPFSAITTIPQPFGLILAPIAVIAFILSFTRIYTTIQYRRALSVHLSNRSDKPIPPPRLPYTIPYLGSTISFLAPKPGLFFAKLFDSYPREIGACTLLLGGQETHLIFSPSAVQALFRSKATTRELFNQQVVARSFGLSTEDVARLHGLDERGMRKDFEKPDLDPVHIHEAINNEKLLKSDAVNELTKEFSRVFRDEVQTELSGKGQTREVGLYAFLRPLVFKASTIALMGEKILQSYPELEDDFFEYDNVMLDLFLGLPKTIIPKAFRIREKTIAGVLRWHNELAKEGRSTPTDPDGEVGWEPYYGSRTNRARQIFYEKIGLSMHGRAGLDLGMMFGLLSNATPTVGWIMMHLLDPNGDATLLPRVLEEVKTARMEDGTLDVPKLTTLPLLQSIFQETLRLYSDTLVTRLVLEDLSLPIEERGNVLVKKGSLAMAPTWLGHRDTQAWDVEAHPSDSFYAERFITMNPETGKPIFSMNGTLGKLFPFGGGKNICPGRVFAKQEVFAALAMVLLTFEFEFLGFVDDKGKDRNQFPGFKDAYSGTTILVMDGDVRVKVKRRGQ